MYDSFDNTIYKSGKTNYFEVCSGIFKVYNFRQFILKKIDDNNQLKKEVSLKIISL